MLTGHIVANGIRYWRHWKNFEASPEVPVTFLEWDLSSLPSVHSAAKQSLADFDRLDICFANAGIMAVPPSLSKDGYEIQVGTNHMGHALLLKHLLPLMAKTARAGNDVRLVTTTSSAFHGASGIAYDTIKTPQPAFFAHCRRYMASKLANTLYSKKIVELYPDIISCSPAAFNPAQWLPTSLAVVRAGSIISSRLSAHVETTSPPKKAHTTCAGWPLRSARISRMALTTSL